MKRYTGGNEYTMGTYLGDYHRGTRSGVVVGLNDLQSENRHTQERIFYNRVHRRVIIRDVSRPLFNATLLKLCFQKISIY